MSEVIYIISNDFEDIELHQMFQDIIISNVTNCFSKEMNNLTRNIFFGPSGNMKIKIYQLRQWHKQIQYELQTNKTASNIFIYEIWREYNKNRFATDAGYIQINNNFWMIEASYDKLQAKPVAYDNINYKNDIIIKTSLEVVPQASNNGIEFKINPKQFNQIFRNTPLSLQYDTINNFYHNEFSAIKKLVSKCMDNDIIQIIRV